VKRILISVFLLYSTAAISGALFHNPSISYLYGDNFRIEPAQQQTFTFEYAAAWEYFDLFLFVDQKYYPNSASGRYGEFSPRLKLIQFSQFSQKSLFKKLTFASTFERGKNGVKTNLLGIGLDFNLPYFKYLTSNLYRRDSPNIAGHGLQMTTTWNFSAQLMQIPILIDGYFDWTFSSDETASNIHINPQIKIDMQEILGGQHSWYLGIEYDYWRHKYGVENTNQTHSNQNTLSLLVKFHF